MEAVFESLKSDLDIRPVYHQTDKAVKAHFHLAVLAYWVVCHTIPAQGKRVLHNLAGTAQDYRNLTGSQYRSQAC
ncbi:MAG: hypothetical protein LKF48_11545 [Prevotella sp.]|nr:hypothetical protein [Prevotella sp.]MCH4183766.1 hypothetical protein [Prevotella sp.]